MTVSGEWRPNGKQMEHRMEASGYSADIRAFRVVGGNGKRHGICVILYLHEDSLGLLQGSRLTHVLKT